ncbi:MAG: AEC family transporter [Candidatus Omnitrophota bacterium]
MLLESFKITGSAVGQIFILGAIGFYLIKKNILGQEGLNALSRLVIEIILPILIFCQLVKDFSFTAYPNWWAFPLISIAITASGLLLGLLFIGLIKGRQQKLQFLNLVGFQNSGFLPLALVAALLPGDKMQTMFIYLFLFLLGFNLLMFSLGVYLLTFTREKKFELASFWSPPVIATLFTLVFIFLGLDKFVPQMVFRPLNLIGQCLIPLSMFVVGGNLAQIKLSHIDRKPMFLMALAKMVILPALGFWLILQLRLPELLGLLILIELAMPPATMLSVITSHYKREDLLVSQGILIGHLLGIITIPVFLSFYFAMNVVK